MTMARGNLIFGLDATASREQTWDSAISLQVQMFREVSTVGTLSMQLVYFRGTVGFDAECKASSWVDDPMTLAGPMAKIRCNAGETQIARVLSHVSREARRRKVNALVFVGDACEESRRELAEGIALLAKLAVPAFMFQEGQDVEVEERFKEITKATHGAYCRFDPGCLSKLSDLLRAVGVFAVGGIEALEGQKSDEALFLLGQLKQ